MVATSLHSAWCEQVHLPVTDMMFSISLTELLERARVRFGVEVEVLEDDSLLTLDLDDQAVAGDERIAVPGGRRREGPLEIALPHVAREPPE